MRRIIFLLAFSLPFLIFGITGCETFDSGYGPTVIQGPKQPVQATKEPEPTYEKKRISAPDEDAPIGPTPKSASQTVQDENIDGKPAVKTAANVPVVNPDGSIRATYKMTFTGNVTTIDPIKRTISIKTKDQYLSFDLIDPVLRGYNTVSDIKISDVVSLAYVPKGTAIAKGETFPEDLMGETVPDQIVPARSRMKTSRNSSSSRSSSNHAAPVRVKYKVNRLTFGEIDNNKDGKISPVELGTVLPSVTMEEFKKYDRNGDGGLDEKEYKAVKKR